LDFLMLARSMKVLRQKHSLIAKYFAVLMVRHMLQLAQELK
jgi:hypothetical protein